MKAPTLIPLSMRRAKGNNHPDINLRHTYMCKIGGRYYIGKFQREWFGLHFDGWEDCGIQFDQPGTNASDWQAIWRIIP